MTTLALAKPMTPIFAVDAVLAAGMGLLLLFLAEPIHAAAGAGLSPETLRIVGGALLPWSAHNWLTARAQPLGTTNFLVQVVGDALWVLLSLALCLEHWPALTTFGRLLYAPQIVLVSFVFAAKVRAFARTR